MKRSRWVSLVLSFAIALAMLPGLITEASAADTYYVGDSAQIIQMIGNCDCDYNSCHSNGIIFSDQSMVEVKGKSIDDAHLMDTVTFLKPGTLTIHNPRSGWDQNEVPAREHKHSRSKTITVVMPEVITQNVRLTVSHAFVGGGIFPEITAPAGANYKVTEATIYREMVNYYPGDKLPLYNAGTELLLELTIEPKAGYYFQYDENGTGTTSGTNIKVTYEGESYDPYVSRKRSDQKLYVDIPVTYESGANYAVTVTDLDEPYHGCTLDYSATLHNHATLTSIRYLMYGKEVIEVKAGDRIGIAIRVRAGEGNVFVHGGKAYWNGRYSEPSTPISDYEVEFVFPYDVKALDHQYIRQVDLFVDAPKVGTKPDTTANTMSPSVTAGAVSWSPAHTTFQKGTVYSVKIPIEAAGANLFPSDIESVSASLNEAKATIVKASSGGVKETLAPKYFLTYTFPVLTEDGAVDQPLKLYAVSEQDIVVKDSKTPVVFEVNVTGADDPTKVEYRWYPCDATGKDLQGRAIGSAQRLELGVVPESDVMKQSFYHCVVSCGDEGDDMIFSVILAPDGAAGIGGGNSFQLVPVSQQDVIIRQSDQQIRLEATVIGAPEGASIDYQWYRCDEDGKSIEDYPRSMVNYLIIDGIPQNERNRPRYYRCSVMVGGDYQELIFSCVLYSMGIENDDPEPVTFADVPADSWYHKSVKTAAEMGLINGKGGDNYAPNDKMTVAEAVKLAACMNIRYNGGDPATDIKNGTDVWYSTYMKYALDNGILDGDLTARANEKITRAEYVHIFSRCLPTDAFQAVNDIPDGSIPDVANTSSAHRVAIYNFYRAGILNGTDATGTFHPDGNINRSEVAAILVRMMDTSFRVGAPSQLNRNP